MSKKKLLKLLLIVFPCVLLDQITKFLARKYIQFKSVVLIDGVLEFLYLENRGAAWGSFQNQRILFIILTLLLTTLLVGVYIKMPESKRMRLMSYLIVFIIAGALGNFIDRILFGYVTDFIYFSLIDFPIFNVADMFVTCSTIILAVLILFYYKDEDFSWINKKKNNGET